MMWLGKGCPKHFKMINQQYLKNDPFLVLRFSYYTFLIDVICGAAIYAMLMILLSILNVSRHVICWNNLSWLLNLNLIYDTVWAGTGSSLLILMLQKLNWFRLTGQHWCYWCENGSFKMLDLTFSSKLDWGSCIISIAKTASKKIGTLNVKFLSPEVALYLYESTIRPCMQYCCHVWVGAIVCYLEMFYKLQKLICRTVGPSLATSLEPLAHRRNVASLHLFYKYYFGWCSFELAELVPLPFSWGRSTHSI